MFAFALWDAHRRVLATEGFRDAVTIVVTRWNNVVQPSLITVLDHGLPPVEKRQSLRDVLNGLMLPLECRWTEAVFVSALPGTLLDRIQQ